ncbi:oligosaccharide flippase family protein [Paracoccus spongiarum]|uniref:Oligosaccharide flippase family protein n=1 Tax=Paracoccus spongiarum TaxID=3064387 RepID=A0ABT9J8C9_9RHOB|nr:oligosaccharide flippase family protein [Paracoccus sp. 2205BS29-5]MDP5305990.1 oligosaccharide flippase family protein [Paracoccus sp. 2205BS29-5]
MRPLTSYLSGTSITQRVLRGSAISGMGYFLSQGIRLASNLILTRLLFPDAFGLMALVTMFVLGVVMMTDVGLTPSIMQSKRGDDPKFLNTAWSVKMMLHGFYFVVICLLAWPAAQFYDAPQLVQLMPAVGASLLIGGLVSPNIEHAMRHIRLGMVTKIDLASQAASVAAMVLFALATRSIWALVFGQFVAAGVKAALTRHYLPGPATRFEMDRDALHELIHFGKWITLSSACGFVLSQGDKAVLGKYLSLEQLGVYNIGFFLASFPMALAENITGRTIIPVYRDSPPQESAQNFATVRRMRMGLSAIVMSMIAVMALGGPWIIDLLYDIRYQGAGPIVALIACAQVPVVLGMTYPQAALAAGDSRSPSLLTMLRAGVQIAAFLIGAEMGGLAGAIIGQMLAGWVLHLFIIRLAIRHRVWDPLHDALFAAVGLLVTFAGMSHMVIGG